MNKLPSKAELKAKNRLINKQRGQWEYIEGSDTK